MTENASVTPEIAALLSTHSQLHGTTIEGAVAGPRVVFDELADGWRTFDLLIAAESEAGPMRIVVQVTGEQMLGETVAEYEAHARRRLESGEATNAIERLAGLIEDSAGVDLNAHRFGHLRYQLFTAVAGALAAAHDAQDALAGSAAVLVVHEVAVAGDDLTRREQNRLEFARFITAVFGVQVGEESDWVLGPFHVPGTRWHTTPLYLAHLMTTA